jgi:hypothetical protein
MNVSVPNVSTYIPLLICGEGTSQEIARVGADGTVVLSKPGADKEAARLFWDAIQFKGKTFRARIAELEAAQPKEVYVVTKGQYSDYGILGVYLDRTLADEFAAQRHADVEVWPLGALDLPRGHRRYSVIMDGEGSTAVYGVNEVDSSDEGADENLTETDDTGPKNEWGYSTRYVYTGYRRFYVTTDMGEQGALKIANERRAQLIALNQWPQKGALVE